MHLTIPLRRASGCALRLTAGIVFLTLLALSHPAAAQSKNRAPGFEALRKEATVAIIPTDIELFEISAGGVLEPKADWTEAALKHFKAALNEKKKSLGIKSIELTDKDADDVAEINALHAAVARSIALHHFGPGFYNLPTKEGKLDWSLGEVTREIKKKTGADYALFSWIRDSYASGERVMTIILLALLSRGQAVAGGGAQGGYASLVELDTGRVLWFNRLARGTGDLREADKAAETLNALLADFPGVK